jgi:hypothetical protein
MVATPKSKSAGFKKCKGEKKKRAGKAVKDRASTS